MNRRINLSVRGGLETATALEIHEREEPEPSHKSPRPTALHVVVHEDQIGALIETTDRANLSNVLCGGKIGELAIQAARYPKRNAQGLFLKRNLTRMVIEGVTPINMLALAAAAQEHDIAAELIAPKP